MQEPVINVRSRFGRDFVVYLFCDCCFSFWWVWFCALTDKVLSVTGWVISNTVACSVLSLFPVFLLEFWGFFMMSSPVGILLTRSAVCFTLSISESDFDIITLAFLSRSGFKELISLVITECGCSGLLTAFVLI